MTIKPKTIEIQGYIVRKFNISEYAELSLRFKGALQLLEGLNGDNQLKALSELVSTCLPELIVAVSYATDRNIEEIKKIDDMELFGNLIIALKDVNDFLALKTTVQNVMTNLFQQKN